MTKDKIDGKSFKYEALLQRRGQQIEGGGRTMNETDRWLEDLRTKVRWYPMEEWSHSSLRLRCIVSVNTPDPKLKFIFHPCNGRDLYRLRERRISLFRSVLRSSFANAQHWTAFSSLVVVPVCSASKFS